MGVKSVEEFEKKYVGRLSAKEFDWDVLKFQEEVDPKYRRAQMRYIGRGATATADSTVIEAENFTLSTMILPSGSVGPLHLHSDVEEVFFILKGQMIALLEFDGEVHEIPLNERDCISVPPGYYRGIKNDTEEDAMMLVMLGTPKPELPTYPEDSELEKVRLERQAERQKLVEKADQK